MKHNNEDDEEGEEEIDEEPLLKSLYEALHREIPDMPTFKQQEREKMIEMASKKNRFKGFKCELKPTSMDVHIQTTPSAWAGYSLSKPRVKLLRRH